MVGGVIMCVLRIGVCVFHLSVRETFMMWICVCCCMKNVYDVDSMRRLCVLYEGKRLWLEVRVICD